MINLLPPSQQEELRQYRAMKITMVLGLIGTVFLVALALVLLTLNIHLGGEVEYRGSVLEAKKGKSRTSQIDSIQEEFSNYNKKITKLHNFYNRQNHPSKFFEELNSVLPSSVYLTSLSYNEMQKGDYRVRVKLSGYCPSREMLLELRNRIDEKPEWKELELPASNWMKPTDINFRINFKVKK